MPSSTRAEFVARFRAQAKDRIAKMVSAFLSLEENPENPDLIADLMRQLHSMKGDAKMLTLPRVTGLVHKTEDLLIWIRQRSFHVTPELVDLVLVGFDLVEAVLHEHESQQKVTTKKVERYIARVDDLLSGHEPPPVSKASRAGDREPEKPSEDGSTKSPLIQATDPDEEAGLHEKAELPNSSPLQFGPDQVIPVPVEKIDFLGEFSGDLIRDENDQETMTAEASRVCHRWLETLEQPPSDAEHDIESARQEQRRRLLQLGREAAGILARIQDVGFQKRIQITKLQDHIRELRLLQIDFLFDRYRRNVRDLAREQGKRIKTVVEGTDVAVDMHVLEGVHHPIIHLIRNAVDHGIESPEERVKKGKPEHGTILLAAKQSGNRVELTVSDDGRGIDPQELRKAAKRLGVGEQELNTLSEAEILNLVFRPEFTTRLSASEVSGRGVGLDVVKREVEALGGTVRIKNRPGQGLSFLLKIPVSMALRKAFMVKSGGRWYGFPSDTVAYVTRVAHEDISQAGDSRSFLQEDQRIPFADLSAILGGARDPAGSEAVSIVVVRHDGGLLGLGCDQLVGERQTVHRALAPFLSGLELIGATTVVDGEVALLVNTPQLCERAATSSGTAGDVAMVSAKQRRILVVDDSDIARDMIVVLLRRLHYEPMEAVNGKDALAQLEQTAPDLLLTDLDMPVMDGVALIRSVRASDTFRDLPVVVLSTRGSDRDKREAMDAGANAYVVKSSFDETKLANLLDTYLAP